MVNDLQGNKLKRKSAWLYLVAFMMAGFSIGFTESQDGKSVSDDLNVVMVDDFDTGIDLWTHSEDSSVSMDWDAVEGSPHSGSLKFDHPQRRPLSHGFLAHVDCMRTKPGERWRIEVMRKKTGNNYGNCLVFMRLFESYNCTGEGSIIGNFPPLLPGFWKVDFWESQVWSTIHSVRPTLLMHVTGRSGPMSCNFDSVVVYNDRAPPVTDVPTLSLAGYLAIASLLALAGCVLLARRSAMR